MLGFVIIRIISDFKSVDAAPYHQTAKKILNQLINSILGFFSSFPPYFPIFPTSFASTSSISARFQPRPPPLYHFNWATREMIINFLINGQQRKGKGMVRGYPFLRRDSRDSNDNARFSPFLAPTRGNVTRIVRVVIARYSPDQ